MSGISFQNNLTVHIDARAVSFGKREDAQILAARTTHAVWDKKSGLMAYSDFAKKFMFPEDTPRSRKNMEIFLSQFLGHLAATARDPGIISEAKKNHRILFEKIKDGSFFSSFHDFLSTLKKDNELGKKHTLVLRAYEEDLKTVESMIQESYPDINFSQARFIEGNEGIKLEVLDSKETASDLAKMQKIFDRSRYWLVQDLSTQRPFPCSPKPGRLYCFFSSMEGEKNAIQVKPEEAALKETYFSEIVHKGDLQEPVRIRPNCRYSRTILLALALAIASCLIPDSFLKRDSL